VTVFAFLSGEICTEDLAGKRRPFRVGNNVCDEASRPIRDIQVGHIAENRLARIASSRMEEKIRMAFAGPKFDTLGGN
jgi:hypothetical protein